MGSGRPWTACSLIRGDQHMMQKQLPSECLADRATYYIVGLLQSTDSNRAHIVRFVRTLS